MFTCTIVTNETDLWKVLNYHLDLGAEIKIERSKGIYGENVIKVLWKYEEEV